eukprot:9104628-Alexandrium_andersonii.AAC.1
MTVIREPKATPRARAAASAQGAPNVKRRHALHSCTFMQALAMDCSERQLFCTLAEWVRWCVVNGAKHA